MKNFNKILLVLLVISVITSSFVFSASAEETATIKKGSYRFNDVLTSPVANDVGYNIIFNSNNTSFSMIGYEGDGTDFVMFFLGDGVEVLFYSTSGLSPNTGLDGMNTDYQIITVTADTDVDDTFATWFKANTVRLDVCDGSACPATDVDLDNICDDCGATFSMVRNFTPSDFPSGYPAVPSVSSDARYYLYRVKSTDFTYLVVYPSSVTPYFDSTEQNGLIYFAESYGNYRLDTSKNEWVLSSDDSPYTVAGYNEGRTFESLYSSVQIKDENGENFFPIPLWEKVEKVTQGEMQQFSQTLGGNLMILTLCGVGCLTLLMALVLLSKTFRTFLAR